MEIAGYGWDHEDWTGGFYPDDLPPEWRLGFYANAYRAVVVPAADWMDLGAAAAPWREDVGEAFRFYLELPEEDDAGALAAAAAQLDIRLGGFLTAAVPAVAETYQARLGHLGPVCRLAGEGPARGPGTLAAALCGAGRRTPPALRAVMEQLAAAAGEHPALLVFGGDPEAPGAMAEARTLGELMGL